MFKKLRTFSLSLLSVANFTCASYQEHQEQHRERHHVQNLLQDPLVQRALATRNPLVITLATELKKRQLNRVKEFDFDATPNNQRFLLNPDLAQQKLHLAGLDHFMEKTNFMKKIAQQKNFNKKEIVLFVDQALAAYITYMEAGPANIRNLVQEIVPQRKEHILEILVDSSRKKG